LWSIKEKNVHYIPAYYLKKLIRKLPKPLGLAGMKDDVQDGEEKRTRRNVKNAKSEPYTDRIQESEVKDYLVLRFVRELDVPIVDGAWVKYKDVMHSMFFRAARKELDAEGGDEDGVGGDDAQWFHLKQFQRNNDLENDGKMYVSDIAAEGDEAGLKDSELDDEDDIVGRSTQLKRGVSAHKFTADEWFAAVVMQAWFRGSRGRMRFAQKKERRNRRRAESNSRGDSGSKRMSLSGQMFGSAAMEKFSGIKDSQKKEKKKKKKRIDEYR
jgi:hypothetical protein